MNRRLSSGHFVLLIGLSVTALTSIACDYSDSKTKGARGAHVGPLPESNITPKKAPGTTIAAEAKPKTVDSQAEREKREAILQNVLRLIETANITPGRDHFLIATQNLNQYFEVGTSPSDYLMPAASREFLKANLDESMLARIESRLFEQIDANHIEDCMLYNTIAARVAGDGDDLQRARRLFDWMIRQIQLVPPQSLAGPGMQQAQARPYDVLMRGMATEANDGFWSERGWLFMALLRQAGIDSGLVSYMPIRPPALLAATPDQSPPDQPVIFATAVLVDGKPYLFDHRIGLPIPDASGNGIATLEEVMTDPDILARLDLPGQSRYGTTRGDLLSSSTKISIFLDSSRGYFSPKMRLLQSRLAGKNRTILYRDPGEQEAHFKQAIGKRLGAVKLWTLPLIVETFRFNNPKFVESTLYSLRMFDKQMPLMFARVAQLKGDTSEAIEQFVTLRFATGALMADKKTPIVPNLQRELDVYATYFLALAQLEQKNAMLAETFFKQLLEITPAPAPNREPCFMLRWGASTNLGLMNLERGKRAEAIRYLSQPDLGEFISRQLHGNLVLARDLVWLDPFATPANPIPPAPERVELAVEQPRPQGQ